MAKSNSTCEKLEVPLGAEGLCLDGKRNLLVYNSASKAEEAFSCLKFFQPNTLNIFFPPWDIQPYDIIEPSQKIINERIKAVSSLCLSDQYNLVTTIEAMTQAIPSEELYLNMVFELVVGQKISYHELIDALVNLGYTRMSNAIAFGEFAVRGSIIDIVNSDLTGVRVDFFGSEVESLRTYNLASQKSIELLERVTILATSEIPFHRDNIELFKGRFLEKFGVNFPHITEAVEQRRRVTGIEWLLPLFLVKNECLLDYLASDTNIYLIEHYQSLMASFSQKATTNYAKRLNLKDVKIPVIEPERVWLSRNLEKHHITLVPGFNSKFSQAPQINNLARLQNNAATDVLKNYLADTKKKCVLACSSKLAINKFKKIMENHDLLAQEVSTITSVKKLPYGTLGLAEIDLAFGFDAGDIVVLSEQEVFGYKISKTAKKIKTTSKLFTEFNAFQQGDLVVHVEHGIGRFEGIETIVVTNAPHDFIKLLYAEGAKFYLPVENMELLTKYGSEGAVLDRLGAVSWQNRKAKIKNKIKLAAEELLRNAALRELRGSLPLDFDVGLFENFCGQFPYVETEDQLRAIEDITADLLADKPMDRLVCGDVGFGKTEVAMRAVFLVLASLSRKQVAILVPTTLLSRQHYKSFLQRFDGYGVKIAQLSKFTPRSEIAKIKDALKKGEIDIVIGTHSLLAKDIEFNNLGMIVIDEEQHFGVKQKEKLKELKANCHILTLSATPIPRTLQMSLAGIKSLSLLASPPQDRLPIRTFVLPFDELTIHEAILREIYRGGRVFFVTPRIAFIDAICKYLDKHVAEVKYAVANGTLSAEQLDDIMNKFYDGEYQVLVATNIIESGLDIPMANTIIIDNAQLFGLAQMYQMRGRVGRSTEQAYAYLTYPQATFVTPEAYKRLDVLKSLDALGAGFSVASHDMDLRGYGNLVGEEQSGQIKEIGFELYQQMLEDAINKLKDKDFEEESEISTSINIGIAIQIPEEYIADASQRLVIFRRLATAINEDEIIEICAELEDRFGELPQSTRNLLEVVRLKNIAKGLHIIKIDLGSKGLVITFSNIKDKILEKLLNFVDKHSDAKLRADQKLLLSRIWETDEAKLAGIKKVLEQLA